MVPEGRPHATRDVWTIDEAALRPVSFACGAGGDRAPSHSGLHHAGDRSPVRAKQRRTPGSCGARDCQEFCARGHDDGKERIITWLSRRNFWTNCLRAAIRMRCLPRTGLLDELKKALSERILNAELDEHLEDERSEGSANRRNGQLEEDGADRHVEDDAVDPARPGRHLRSEADRQISAPLPRLRRQDHLDVRARHDGARDPRPPRGALRHRRVAGPDLGGHRRGPGGGGRMAEPAAGRAAIRSSSSTRSGSRSGTKASSATRPSTSRSASCRTARRRFWASGSSRPRAPSSGCAS